MFDFRLKVFFTVAKKAQLYQSCGKTVHQPAITKNIKEIEHHFKVKLFDRNGTKIKLTPPGETLLQYAE